MTSSDEKTGIDSRARMTPDEWKRLAEMTDDEIADAAATDPDTPPAKMTAGPSKSRRVALAKFVRQKLGVSREEFAAAYGIPFDILKAWERHEAEPTPAEVAYLKLIEREPELAKAVVPAGVK